MENFELEELWLNNQRKLDQVLILNQGIALEIARQKLNHQVKRLYRPKWFGILLGIPYSILLTMITIVAFMGKAFLVAFGFGVISLIMWFVLIWYFYQMYLIDQVSRSEDIVSTQKQLSCLKKSTIQSIYWSVFQLPFWTICWMSIDTLIQNPLIYGGFHLLLFIIFGWISVWLFKNLKDSNNTSKVYQFFFSGNEWDPIVKSEEILRQVKELEKMND